jgi:hypothetical protein
MLAAIERGEQDPLVLAELAKGRLREKLPQLRLALEGRIRPDHRLLIGELLDHIEYVERAIHRVEVTIAQALDEHERRRGGAAPLAHAAGHRTSRGGGDTGGDRPGHDPLPLGEAPRLVGGSVSGEQTKRGQASERRHHARQQTPQNDPVRIGGQHRPSDWDVSPRALPSHRPQTGETPCDGGRSA